MITLESNRQGTRFAVVADDRLLVTTTKYEYAKEVYDRAKNNDIDFAEKNFIPFTPQDPKILQL
jgi:hypothetical protein